MYSKDLEELGFCEWNEITKDRERNKDLILKLPKKKGVYVIRANKPISRLKGESDIIYIGKGTIQSRIQQLLRSYLPLNFRDYIGKHTAREAFERVLNETQLKLELSYIIADIEASKAKVLELITYRFKKDRIDNQIARELESKLLQWYCRDHIEPPPLNNTRR